MWKSSNVNILNNGSNGNVYNVNNEIINESNVLMVICVNK